MAYLAVAYPNLRQEDFDWIQEYRSRNDPRYFNVVDPHFTLLFPVEDFNEDNFIEEVRLRTENFKPIDFVIRGATLNQHHDGSFFNEFLIVDEGNSDFIKLHNQLYSGLFKDKLRLDIDFIPHLGIGNNEEGNKVLTRVNVLNDIGIEIKGSVDTISIINYENGVVSLIDEIKLQ